MKTLTLTPDIIRQQQHIINEAMDAGLAEDGVAGPVTNVAFTEFADAWDLGVSTQLAPVPVVGAGSEEKRFLEGDPARYKFRPYIDGEDIRIDGVTLTWFGGRDDPDDNGETASGYSTAQHAMALYCALPLPQDHACHGTPLPALPFGITVEVTERNSRVMLPLILRDYGPSPSGEAIGDVDVSPGAFRAWGSALSGPHGERPVAGSFIGDVRIVGGAAYVPKG